MRHMFVSSSIFSYNSSLWMLSILRFISAKWSYELTSNSVCIHRRTAEICWVIFATRFQLPFLMDFYWAVFQIIHASWKLTNKREINLQHCIVMNSPLSLLTLFLKNAYVICKHVTVLFVFFFWNLFCRLSLLDNWVKSRRKVSNFQFIFSILFKD